MSLSVKALLSYKVDTKVILCQAPSAKANDEPTMTGVVVTIGKKIFWPLANSSALTWLTTPIVQLLELTWPPLLDHNGTTSLTWLHFVNWFSNIPHVLKRSCQQGRVIKETLLLCQNIKIVNKISDAWLLDEWRRYSWKNLCERNNFVLADISSLEAC